VKGPTYALIGETTKARAGGGEFISSVDLGAKLIGNQIANRLGIQDNLVNQYSYRNPEIMTPSLKGISAASINVNVGGSFELDGHKLRVVLDNANQNQYYLG
jgi:hypothetical protein